MNRGMTVLATWRHLLGDKTPTEDEHFSVVVLAWCVELVCKVFIDLLMVIAIKTQNPLQSDHNL